MIHSMKSVENKKKKNYSNMISCSFIFCIYSRRSELIQELWLHASLQI